MLLKPMFRLTLSTLARLHVLSQAVYLHRALTLVQRIANTQLAPDVSGDLLVMIGFIPERLDSASIHTTSLGYQNVLHVRTESHDTTMNISLTKDVNMVSSLLLQFAGGAMFPMNPSQRLTQTPLLASQLKLRANLSAKMPKRRLQPKMPRGLGKVVLPNRAHHQAHLRQHPNKLEAQTSSQDSDVPGEIGVITPRTPMTGQALISEKSSDFSETTHGREPSGSPSGSFMSDGGMPLNMS